jgi:hypothetical protein
MNQPGQSIYTYSLLITLYLTLLSWLSWVTVLCVSVCVCMCSACWLTVYACECLCMLIIGNNHDYSNNPYHSSCALDQNVFSTVVGLQYNLSTNTPVIVITWTVQLLHWYQELWLVNMCLPVWMKSLYDVYTSFHIADEQTMHNLWPLLSNPIIDLLPL